MGFNSLLSKSAQQRIANGESPADAVKAQPVAQPTAEEVAAMDARLAAMDANSPAISELSKLSDEALERWLR